MDKSRCRSRDGQASARARPRILAARLSDEEHAQVLERAGRLEISLSELVRRAVLSRPLTRSKIPALNMRAIGELGRIGNNLNQLVKLAHMGRVSEEIGTVALEVRAEVELLREQLAGAHVGRGRREDE